MKIYWRLEGFAAEPQKFKGREDAPFADRMDKESPMKRRQFSTYGRALEKHPGAFIELKYRRVDASFRGHEKVPVATYPAIYVWPDKKTAETGSESECIEIYWLLIEDFF
jgi:hypothetical protein